MEEYRIATYAEKKEAKVYDDYDLLIGPDGFQCVLTEPEDRIFGRDLKPLVIELNRLRHLNVKLKETVSIKQDRINDLENALHRDYDGSCKLSGAQTSMTDYCAGYQQASF